MQQKKILTSIPFYTALGRSINILTLECFGNGSFFPFGMQYVASLVQ